MTSMNEYNCSFVLSLLLLYGNDLVVGCRHYDTQQLYFQYFPVFLVRVYEVADSPDFRRTASQ